MGLFLITVLFAVLIFASSCNSAGQKSNPAGDSASPFRVEPSRTVLGLPAGGDVDATMPLWGVFDRDSNRCPQYLTTDVTWTSLDTSIVHVDDAGILTPISPGQTAVRADYEEHTAYAEVVVSGILYTGSLMQGTRRRTYLLYVPAIYDGVIPLPLVLGLHGGGGSAQDHRRISQLDRAAHDHGFFALYPDGTGPIQTWNGGNCCGKAVETGVDDVGFLRQLIDRIGASFALDRKRVYTTGFSNGAILSHRLACEGADILAAAAPIAGGLNLGGDFKECSPTRPVPIVMFHGKTDESYPIAGGVGTGISGTDFYPIEHPTDPDTLEDWIHLNGAQATGTMSYQKGDATCVTYPGVAPVILCIVDPAKRVKDDEVVCDGGGHAYPGGVRSSRDKGDVPSQDIDTNETMWEFFSSHELP